MPSNDTATRPPVALESQQVLIAFSGLVLVLLLAALDSTIVATALPTIVSDLGGLQHLAWVVTAYLLAQTVVTPIYGSGICTAARSCSSSRPSCSSSVPRSVASATA